MKQQNIIFWGSYDIGKPRVRLLLKAAALLDYQITEIHKDIWHNIEDKSQMKSNFAAIKKIFSMLFGYPKLLALYLLAPRHKIVVIPYLGLFDVFMLWPYAKLRGAKIHWDIFVSLYDTIVNDRKLYPAYHPFAIILYCLEWLACRLSDVIFVDTAAHAQYLNELYYLPNNHIKWIPVGVEEQYFSRNSSAKAGLNKTTKVMFYGQFIPLHGIDAILDAVKLDQSGTLKWTIVGKGQLRAHIDQRIKFENIQNIKRISWVPYEQLGELIQQSDIALGIFGRSQKALNVIPNKLYQIMAMGKPFVTADSPAIRSLGLQNNQAVSLCYSNDGASLLASVLELADRIQQQPELVKQHAEAFPVVNAEQVSEKLQDILA